MTTPRIVTVPGVRPVFQVAAGDAQVATGQARYNAAHYDVSPEATYAGLDAQWTDDSCDVIDAATFYGRQRSIDAFDVGTATFRVANPDGLWDYPPTNPATPLTLRPGRMVRVGVIVGAAPAVWLWTGWIDATQPGYDPGAGDVVTVNAVCAKGEAGRVEAGRVSAAVGAHETVTARMARLADVAGFAAHRRQFDPTGTTLQATQLGGRVGQLMDDAAKSGGGDVFGDENGFLVYRGKDWQTRTVGTPDAIIGNRGVPDEICPGGWEVSFTRADFTTRVLYGRSGVDPAQLNDDANRGRFGIETWPMTSLQTESDAELANLAARALRVRNFDRAPLIAAVTVDAARPGVIDLLTAASPFKPSLYVCGHVADGRAVFTRTLFCTGVAHQIDAAHWTARLALDDAAPWLVPANTRYNSAHYDADVYTVVA